MALGNNDPPILAQPRWWNKLINLAFSAQKVKKQPFNQFRGRILVTGLDWSGKTTLFQRCFGQGQIEEKPTALGISSTYVQIESYIY
jgi:hypothetical protein